MGIPPPAETEWILEEKMVVEKIIEIRDPVPARRSATPEGRLGIETRG
jgi:hypothetical protein